MQKILTLVQIRLFEFVGMCKSLPYFNISIVNAIKFSINNIIKNKNQTHHVKLHLVMFRETGKDRIYVTMLHNPQWYVFNQVLYLLINNNSAEYSITNRAQVSVSEESDPWRQKKLIEKIENRISFITLHASFQSIVLLLMDKYSLNCLLFLRKTQDICAEKVFYCLLLCLY